MRLVLLDQAKEDLANIAAYIAYESKSRQVGQKFAQRLLDKCKELASIKGSIGVERPELRKNLRSCPFGSYIIFFKYSDNYFEVVTIIERHRDIEAIFDHSKMS
jgi:toxin ParE1/3/4